MNLILFSDEETRAPLPRSDARAVHLLDVLRRQIGDTCDVGMINGPRGKATLAAMNADVLTLAFAWGEMPPPLAPIRLIVGLPRPQTARKILQEATTLGVAAIHFVATDRGEPSYAQSSLWTSGEWRRHLLDGAAQAFCTRIPQVTWGGKLADVLANIPSEAGRLALDNYEATRSLGQWARGEVQTSDVWLVLGSERGWTAREREVLRAAQCEIVHLGARVLRLETAVVSAVAIAKLRFPEV